MNNAENYLSIAPIFCQAVETVTSSIFSHVSRELFSFATYLRNRHILYMSPKDIYLRILPRSIPFFPSFSVSFSPPLSFSAYSRKKINTHASQCVRRPDGILFFLPIIQIAEKVVQEIRICIVDYGGSSGCHEREEEVDVVHCDSDFRSVKYVIT